MKYIGILRGGAVEDRSWKDTPDGLDMAQAHCDKANQSDPEQLTVPIRVEVLVPDTLNDGERLNYLRRVQADLEFEHYEHPSPIEEAGPWQRSAVSPATLWWRQFKREDERSQVFEIRWYPNSHEDPYCVVKPE